jgi:hypothetical protein
MPVPKFPLNQYVQIDNYEGEPPCVCTFDTADEAAGMALGELSAGPYIGIYELTRVEKVSMSSKFKYKTVANGS